MSITCDNLFNLLAKDVEYANDVLTNNMTDLNNEYQYSCVKPNMSYTYYSTILNERWTNTVHRIENNNCLLNFNSVSLATNAVSLATKAVDLPIETDDIIQFAQKAMTKTKFKFSDNFSSTAASLLTVYFDSCNCEIHKLFKIIILKYGKNYGKKFIGMDTEKAKQMLRSDRNAFESFVQELKNFGQNPTNIFSSSIHSNQNQLFSLENELNQLIPDSLGTMMKSFFIKMIVTYYNNLHPIIWAQIFSKMVTKYFDSMPLTKEDSFQYFSQNLLLNSGPTILKIIQMVRPALDDEQLQKYHLKKLEYPLLTINQVTTILNNILPDPNMYTYLNPSISASVGHVVIIKRIDQYEPIIIKIIKPISICQACYEYDALQNVYSADSCEQKFIDNMGRAIGAELNVNQERENINNAYKYYTTNYKKVYGKDISSKLTTLEVVPNVVDPRCWYAIAVTVAPGLPLSKLVEGNGVLNFDSKYTASLHRCLDLLVYKFFHTILQHGFYHGDLHAGNVFFSYKMQQMTLIDLGAVGHIDLFSDDPSVNALTEIIIMSIFYNYDGILHRLTELLNQLCGESKINTESESYKNLALLLLSHREQNLRNYDNNEKIYRNNIDMIFNDDNRLKLENVDPEITSIVDYKYEHIYDLLRLPVKPNEVIVENDILLPKINMTESTEFTLVKVLELIFKYYAINNINVPVKFGELVEFQKAYGLLLGILTQTKYNMSRMSYAITQAIVNKDHISKIWHVGKVTSIAKMYMRESSAFKELKKKLTNPNPEYESAKLPEAEEGYDTIVYVYDNDK